MQRVFAAIQIYSPKVLWVSFDFGKAKTYAAMGIRATESAPIAPCGVEAVVRSPGDRPQVAAIGRGLIIVPMPVDGADHCALRVRRSLGGEIDFGGRKREA